MAGEPPKALRGIVLAHKGLLLHPPPVALLVCQDHRPLLSIACLGRGEHGRAAFVGPGRRCLRHCDHDQVDTIQ